jgi:hypothetical protein
MNKTDQYNAQAAVVQLFGNEAEMWLEDASLNNRLSIRRRILDAYCDIEFSSNNTSNLHLVLIYLDGINSGSND